MLRCFVLIAILLLIGCADTNGAAPARDFGGSVPLPSREPSSLTEYVLDGAATEMQSAGAVASGSALILDGTASGFEYGVYRFNPGLDGPDSVSVLLEEVVTTGAWIGLANYTTNRWDFSGPFTKQKTLVVDDPAYTSPAGNIWVAVVTAGHAATVNALSVRTIKPTNQAPVAAFNTDVISGNAPLTVQFDASGSTDADGDIVEYAWDFDGDGLYEGFSDTPLCSHTFTAPGLFQVKLRVTDDQFARGSTTTDISVNAVGNQPPFALANATPDDGEGPFNASLDASGSTDSDGVIVNYDWDFDSDGTYDALNAGPQTSHTFSTVGSNDVTLRVTDNQGAQDTYTFQVLVRGWLAGQPITSVGDVGWYSSLQIVDGIPSVACFDATNQDLVFVRSADPDGYGWNPPLAIDTGGNVGIHNCMAIVNGNPAISYYDNTNAHPKFIRCADQDGVTWNMPVTVDSSGVAGAFNSLAVVNGNPAISYYKNGANDLLYVRATDANGTSWGMPVTVVSAGDVGQYSSLIVVNGQPAVSYFNNTTADVEYVRASDANGTAWGMPVTVDSAGSVGQFTSMVLANGQPAISYYDLTNGDLKYVRSLDANGTAWGMPQTLDSAGNQGQYASMAIVNGNPAIAYVYFDPMSSADLRYIAAADPDGAAWNMPQTIDSNGNAGQYCSLGVNNGKAMVSYYDWGSQQLKFIHRF